MIGKKTFLIFIIIIISLLNIFVFLKGFNLTWEYLISREPVEHAIVGRNVLRFGLLNINKERLHAVGNYGLKRNFDVPIYNHPPFTYLICAMVFKIFGVSIQSTKLVALLFGILTIIFIMLFTYDFFKEPSMVLIAGFISSLIPISIYHNQAIDHFWIDIFFFILFFYFYYKGTKDNFRAFKNRIFLYIFVILGIFNGWRILILAFILFFYYLATILFSKEKKDINFKFLIGYIVVLFVSSWTIISYIEYMYKVNFFNFAFETYKKTETIPSHISWLKLLGKYIKIHNLCYTPIVYISSFLGLGKFLSDRNIPENHKYFISLFYIFGFIAFFPWKWHGYFSYNMHCSFHIPFVLMSAYFFYIILEKIENHSKIAAWIAGVILLSLLILNSNFMHKKWAYRHFPLRGFESTINKLTIADDVLASNVDLTGLNNPDNTRNHIDLHNMFFMDRHIHIYKNRESFIDNLSKYKYFIFEKNEENTSKEEALFHHLINNYKYKSFGEYYIFQLTKK